MLKNVQIGQAFIFNEKPFIKLEKKRTRSICQQVDTKKKYLISEVAEVKLVTSE